MRINRIYSTFVRYFYKNPERINISGILVIALLILGSGSIYGIPFLGIAVGGPGSGNSMTPQLSSSSGNTLLGIIGDAFVYLSNNIVNTTAYYDVVFRTGSADNIATIDLIFPLGTSVLNARIIEVSGVSPGSSSVNGQTVTYTIKSAPLIQAGATIRLEIANVVNPPNPDPGLKVQVKTKNSGGSIIDSGTSFAYSIKPVGRVYSAHSGNVTVGVIHDFNTAYADCGTGLAVAGGYVWLNLISSGSGQFSAHIVDSVPNGHSWKVTAQSNYFSHYNTTYYAWATCLQP